jgi:septal ring factor EnvC (AmiA/AmiB activator)
MSSECLRGDSSQERIIPASDIEAYFSDLCTSIDRLETGQSIIGKSVERTEKHLERLNGQISVHATDIAKLQVKSAYADANDKRIWELLKQSAAPIGIVVLLLKEFIG